MKLKNEKIEQHIKTGEPWDVDMRDLLERAKFTKKE
jgi:hypothetical protein